MSESEVPEDLAREARERVDEMPAESITGAADPQGGSLTDPADYRNVQNDESEQS